MNTSEKTKQLLLKDLGSAASGKEGFKKYKPATYPVTLSTDYKSTLSLVLSSLEFIHQIGEHKINKQFTPEDFSEDPYVFLELIKKPEPERSSELMTRYYVFTKKLRDLMDQNANEKETTIPITGEEYYIAKSTMLTNLLTMSTLAEDKQMASKNTQMAKTLTDYATLTEAFLLDKDIEINSSDILIISYSMYYSITKQWQNQADASGNYTYLKPEEAAEFISQEDIEKFIKNINPLSN